MFNGIKTRPVIEFYGLKQKWTGPGAAYDMTDLHYNI